MTNREKERLKEIISNTFYAYIDMRYRKEEQREPLLPAHKTLIKVVDEYSEAEQTLLSLIDRQPGEVFIGIINNDKLADAIANDCHDPGHDIRWCGTCETREAAIFDYRESIRKALNIKEEG